MIVLDTNVVSEILKPEPDPRVVAWLKELTDDVSITAITLAELLAGLRRLPDGRRKAELSAGVDRALRPYRDSRAILAFDDDAANHYADVLILREKAGRPISMADAQIAAICRVHHAVCATRNMRDFQHTGVVVVNPWTTRGES
ncbi:MAG: type II toxin-antitoxin system VapC family toxin [Propionicimonas sp.]|uniref:type II toxin-antitoxin system VapC family toxin n=1 Tax=Propionicimonas sp. TaxID=1955623 RepID=UPI002B1EFDA7|nr:type II toxin-antitoxin system VapC family toxin [Propionicimonas sp.]MEA4943534.1 type II toxin-antitoxin system VapC family toxin [Propionicimonas sp.]MEA5055505.1 type II toxin-antitoxin system VapC family toxin [Propionicimonas sp.]MEA5117358.1 type II toxin-antitoxin system VapC family toxin [Propionicimonas sp.]